MSGPPGADGPGGRSGRLAAVLAHPDDESRIIGGTLALAAERGCQVSLYCATRGEAGDPRRDPGEVAALRERELREACSILGVAPPWLDDLPDGGLSEVAPRLLVERITRFLRSVRPHAVITFGPDGYTGHRDHITVGRRAGEAFEAASERARFPGHLDEGLRVWQPTRLYHPAVAASVARRLDWRGPSLPDEQLLAVDVGEVLDRKRRAAVEAHASQWALSPFDLTHGWGPRSVEYLHPAGSGHAGGRDPVAALA